MWWSGRKTPAEELNEAWHASAKDVMDRAKWVKTCQQYLEQANTDLDRSTTVYNNLYDLLNKGRS